MCLNLEEDESRNNGSLLALLEGKRCNIFTYFHIWKFDRKMCQELTTLSETTLKQLVLSNTAAQSCKEKEQHAKRRALQVSLFCFCIRMGPFLWMQTFYGWVNELGHNFPHYVIKQQDHDYMRDSFSLSSFSLSSFSWNVIVVNGR